MQVRIWRTTGWPALLLSASGFTQQVNSFATLMHFKAGVSRF
jgi:hypothetical protein